MLDDEDLEDEAGLRLPGHQNHKIRTRYNRTTLEVEDNKEVTTLRCTTLQALKGGASGKAQNIDFQTIRST